MPRNTTGLHHFHVRKRRYKKHEQYPHPNKFKRFLDKIIYLVAIVGPIMTIPQLMKIWVDKNAAGVSAVSWGAYFFISIFWVTYGIAHKDKPIIFSSSIWVILHGLVAVGTLLYG